MSIHLRRSVFIFDQTAKSIDLENFQRHFQSAFGESDLRLLATERAKQVKEKILSANKVEAERVFVAEATAESADPPAR